MPNAQQVVKGQQVENIMVGSGPRPGLPYVAILFGYVALLVCHLDEPQDALLLCARADHDSTALSAAVGLTGNSVSENWVHRKPGFREHHLEARGFREDYPSRHLSE